MRIAVYLLTACLLRGVRSISRRNALRKLAPLRSPLPAYLHNYRAAFANTELFGRHACLPLSQRNCIGRVSALFRGSNAPFRLLKGTALARRDVSYVTLW